MRVALAYGRGRLPVDVPEDAVVLAPHDEPGLPDERAAIAEALRRPIGSRPLQEIARGARKVAIAVPDGTRPCPSDRILPPLLAELGLPPERVEILVGTGTHRANTPEELEAMLGADVARRYPIVNHVALDAAALVYLGTTPRGGPVWINRRYLEADVRIAVGFIEPHFMAGFSGGPKGVIPALAGMDTVLHLHSAALLDDPRATWGVLAGNPVQEEIRAAVALAPPQFLVNVTLNRQRAITGVYAGHYIEAHEAGAEAVRRQTLLPVDHPFDVVLTTNSGYPLDQNLYQTVKGMSAAARVVRPGGAILVASECSDGIPDHGNFKELLFRHRRPEDLLAEVRRPGFRLPDQWEAQILAQILQKARVLLYSSLDPQVVARCLLEPVADLARSLQDLLATYGPRLAVLPEGPLTLPTLAAPAAAG